jgi:lipopolysaccharide/colanic/teichoic acid biosynthesis glycosyltransferase
MSFTTVSPRGLQFAIKHAFDRVLAALLVVSLSPVLLLSALAVKVSSRGPILFRQQRTGRHGVRFGMYKFRTMVRNAEELKASLAHLNILPPPDFKVIDDPRITRVGGFLRKTSLDELPQVLNVLRGEMSIVGPRPTSFSASTYDLWQTVRLEALPGITGLWQVFGRNSTTFDERLRLDVAYIRNISFWLDLKIIAWTLLSVVRRQGA